jgi:hypothetical protein
VLAKKADVCINAAIILDFKLFRRLVHFFVGSDCYSQRMSYTESLILIVKDVITGPLILIAPTDHYFVMETLKVDILVFMQILV